MSELRSAIEALRSETLAELPDARVEEDFAELHRAAELLHTEWLRRLAELERRGVHAREGHLSAASWLAVSGRMAFGEARASVRMARALQRMPAARAALEAGEISMGAGRILASAYGADPRSYARSEAALVQAARIHRIADLQRVTGYWRQAVEAEQRVADGDPVHERRGLSISATLFGAVRVDGDLDPENGEALMTAVRALMDAEARHGAPDDDRTARQRRADALGELCRQWLDRRDRPAVGGERPHLTVTVQPCALHGEDAARAEADHAGPVRSHVARTIACDAAISRVVMAGASEPLDVGRRTPVVPPSMRRAVIVRDRTCTFPGCDRPHAWCDAHHLVHWADGGPTSVANLVLLCRRHHRAVHRPGGFGLALEAGRPVFRRPDGSVMAADRAPP